MDVPANACLTFLDNILLVKCVHCSNKALGGFCLWTTTRFTENSTWFPLSPSSSPSRAFPSTSPSSWMGPLKWQLRYPGLECVPDHSCLLQLSSSFLGSHLNLLLTHPFIQASGSPWVPLWITASWFSMYLHQRPSVHLPWLIKRGAAMMPARGMVKWAVSDGSSEE